MAPHSFLFQGADYDVPCVWQVWVKNTAAALFTEQLPVNEHALRPITKPVTSVDDFSFVTRESGDFHAVIQRVGQRCGQIFLDVGRFLAKDRSTEAGNFYYIRVADVSRKDEILNRLVALDLEHDETKYDTASSHHSISKSRICHRYSNK